jgi:hypothetical protein
LIPNLGHSGYGAGLGGALYGGLYSSYESLEISGS